jgi:UDP-N-acetyl-2-amino-2-deoxyglucuronate dehydrogenase
MLREGSTVRAGSNPAALSVAAHANQYRDFVDAVRNDRPPRVTVADGIRTVAVIRALYRSAGTGRPVRIDPLNETHAADPDYSSGADMKI